MPQATSKSKLWPWIVVALTPLFFSSNLIFGRSIVSEVAPFTLAFLRWFACSLILFPIVWRERQAATEFIKDHTWMWLFIGFFGMWVCGAIVYLALQYTTAVNSSLIYTTSPLFIILIQFFWIKRAIKLREILGIIAATLGVAYIVLEGELARIARLELNIGDLLILGCAVAWALYSILQKTESCKSLPMFAMFGLMTMSGTILLAPFALYEFIAGAPMPQSQHAYISIAGIITLSSMVAFSGTLYAIRHLGPEINGMSLYLLPVYGVLLAVVFLGEEYRFYHFIGSILVLGGVMLASIPAKYFSIFTSGNKSTIQ